MQLYMQSLDSALALIVFLFILAPVQGDLVSCDDCCKGYEHVSITSFDSNVTGAGPLSWSMNGPYTLDVGHDKKTDQHWRDFFLNTPPSLNLTNTTDYSGCALFFYNATAALQADANHQDKVGFSCDSVMASQCQQDLNQQALDDLALLLDPNNGQDLTPAEESNTCRTLASRFADREVPQSCSFYVQQATWGYATGQGTQNNLTHALCSELSCIRYRRFSRHRRKRRRSVGSQYLSRHKQ